MREEEKKRKKRRKEQFAVNVLVVNHNQMAENEWCNRESAERSLAVMAAWMRRSCVR